MYVCELGVLSSRTRGTAFKYLFVSFSGTVKPSRWISGFIESTKQGLGLLITKVLIKFQGN